jgi:hypothetical protein
MAVHPIGLAIMGVSMSGFSALHLAANPRAREAWGRISDMGLAELGVMAVPAILILAVAGKPLTAALTNSDITSATPTCCGT